MNRSRPAAAVRLAAVLALGAAVASTASATPAARIVASLHLGDSPQAIAIGDGSVWLTTLRSLVRIDPETNQIVQRVRFKAILGALTLSGGQLWLARNPIDTGTGIPPSSQLRSVDAATGRSTGRPIRFRLVAGLSAAFGAIWVTNGNHGQYGRLFRVDPRRRRVTATLRVPGDPEGAVSARGLLWVAASDTGNLFRIDPRAATLVGKPARVGKALLTVAADRSRIWVGDSYAGAVISVDPRTAAVVTRTRLHNVSDVAIGGGAAWATVDQPSELVRLDPKSGARVGRPLPVPGTASGVAVGFGSIWVMTSDGVVRVRP
jgi:streptogramin lyase